MKNLRGMLPSFVVVMLCAAPLVSAWAQAERLRFDTPTQINGIELVCTGIGREVREDPAWDAYALKIEVAGEQGQFLGNVEIVVQREEESIVEIVCGGPWILAQLEPGSYNVSASYGEESRTGAANVVPNEQTRLVLQIPGAAGEVSAERASFP